LFKKNYINLSFTTLVEPCLSWAVKLNCQGRELSRLTTWQQLCLHTWLALTSSTKVELGSSEELKQPRHAH